MNSKQIEVIQKKEFPPEVLDFSVNESAEAFVRTLDMLAFNEETFQKNLATLRVIRESELLGHWKVSIQDTDFHPLGNLATGSADSFISDIDMLKEMFMQSVPSLLGLEEERKSVESLLGKSEGLRVIVTSSHRYDYDIIKLAEERGIPLSEIGYVTLDSHIDINGTSLEEGANVTKANFLGSLLDEGLGAVVHIGSDDEMAGIYEDGENLQDHDESESFQIHRDIVHLGRDHIYEPNKDKIMIIHDKDYLPGGAKKVSQKRLIGKIPEIIQHFESKGIKQVVISVDIDVLDTWHERITTTEYSNWSLLILLGKWDVSLSVEDLELMESVAKSLRENPNLLNEIQQKTDKPAQRNDRPADVSMPSNSSYQIKSFFQDFATDANKSPVNRSSVVSIDDLRKVEAFITDTYNSIARHFNSGNRHSTALRKRYLRKPHVVGFIEELIEAIDDRDGITLGLPVGDNNIQMIISEVMAVPDLEGNTARLINDLAAALK